MTPIPATAAIEGQATFSLEEDDEELLADVDEVESPLDFADDAESDEDDALESPDLAEDEDDELAEPPLRLSVR